MSLGAVYLWEPEVTAKIPNLNESERTAYELYQKHRNTPAKGRKIKDWAEFMLNKVTDDAYSDYFTEETKQWCINLQQEILAEPRAVLELDHFDHIAQGDALYRVFYEAVKETGVGFYEPRFAVWGFSVLQVPADAVAQVLKSYLEPLSSEQQSFDLDNIEAPRNIKNAEELFNLWCSQHPLLKKYELHIFCKKYDFMELDENDSDAKTAVNNTHRSFNFICETRNIFYQLQFILWGFIESHNIDFSFDLSNHFLTPELKEKFGKKLKFRIDIADIRDITRKNSSESYRLNFDIVSRKWESAYGVKTFFQEFDKFVKFLNKHFSDGNLQSLQAWAYGDALDHVLVQMHWSQELMIIALGLDKEYLEERYQFHQNILSNEKRDAELEYLNDSYKEYQVLMELVREAGTALAPYLKKN
ncbi:MULTISPECIES: hypothetical protein [unclassified Acinetobacter]|uniref:hypothetical protein n=1 Tax=unclassified Acinetobacter TaxID=196816 RepID=UPI0015D240FE|nr:MULTISPECIES: hypothetical protein [unclassified Acinetobacter]UUS60251.1 hypothetical protein MST17_12980 [Acinetobacter sp. YH16056_T]